MGLTDGFQDITHIIKKKLFIPFLCRRIAKNIITGSLRKGKHYVSIPVSEKLTIV